MTFKEYEFQFKRLVKFYNLTKVDDRMESYFGKLQKFQSATFSEAINQYVDKGEKFPSIAQLLELCVKIEPTRMSQLDRQCNVCDGHGWVFILGMAYRGKCEHGELLNPKIRVAPTNEIAIEGQRERIRNEHRRIYGKELFERKFNMGDTPDPHWWK